MRREELDLLLSPRGRAELELLASEPLTPDTHLATAERLRAKVGPAAGVLLEAALLRAERAP